MILEEKHNKVLKEVLSTITNYLNSNHFRSAVFSKNLKKITEIKIPQKGFSPKKIVKIIDYYFDNIISTHHPHFFNQLFSGFDFYSFLAEIIISATNTSMYTFEVAPIQSLIELELLNKITAMIEFPKKEENTINGTFVTGGSNANLIALTVARESYQKNSNEKININQLRVYVSEHAHYSFEKAMIISGIGLDNLVKIKSNKKGQINITDLERNIKEDIQKKKIPFFIGATSGTTVLGSFDDINSLMKISKKYKLWLHVDGAWGGSVIFSEKHKKLLSGLSKADSFCFDAHKMLGVSLICSVLLFKDEQILKKINETRVNYLFHHENSEQNTCQDLGEYSFQCGRRAEAVKLWLAWCAYGNIGYQKRIDKLFSLAKWTENKIKENKNFELIYPVFSVNVCFRFIGKENIVKEKKDNKFLNEVNLKIRNRLISNNLYMINFTKEKINNEEILFLRLVILHPKVNQKIIGNFLKEVIQEGNK